MNAGVGSKATMGTKVWWLTLLNFPVLKSYYWTER